MTVFRQLDDRELAEAIDRLARLVEKLGREGTQIAHGLQLHYAAALDEAVAERERRNLSQSEGGDRAPLHAQN